MLHAAIGVAALGSCAKGSQERSKRKPEMSITTHLRALQPKLLDDRTMSLAELVLRVQSQCVVQNKIVERGAIDGPEHQAAVDQDLKRSMSPSRIDRRVTHHVLGLGCGAGSTVVWTSRHSR